MSPDALSSSSAVREISEDCDDQEQEDPRNSHQAGVSDRPRSFRFDSSYRCDDGNDHREDKPDEPVHDCGLYKMHATATASGYFFGGHRRNIQDRDLLPDLAGQVRGQALHVGDGREDHRVLQVLSV